ncbi:DNA internalization-related competence protein ComEC/Rec2 [Shewanella sp. YLB-07]|uniref:DNA internalization-related competence protein ComEC/Rec2 n=1 Tax=Shewanella sp. YLB-07 TaxID=2601268 RepID=UPI00128B1CA3|nr:DNA internalization-related competence protein ComEC/Rec2 [Shewanella sp. YLB-07]MPY21665.1 DNA internalization-related competence protein ComEC/Rec2 [Shewanella sp. YLB-07]
MNRFMFGFSITILSSLLWPVLPSTSVYIASVVVGIIALKRTPVIAGVLLAVGWISLFVQLLLVDEPPNSVQNIIVRGEIIALVGSNGDWLSMDIRQSNLKSAFLLSKVLRLSWKQPPKLAIGEQWELVVKPKPITSVLNQGGYNQQRSFFSRHIVMKGNVKSGIKLGEALSFRSKIIKSLKPELAHFAHGDLMLALLLGDKSLIDSERWRSLRVSGSGHLIAISGLHLSVVTTWVFFLSLFLLTRFKPSLSRKNILIAGLLSAVAAIFYAYLAGFSLPTQRALIMLLLLLTMGLMKRFSSSWERLLYALFLILLFDPLACMSAGFWLSFSALGIIFLTLSYWTRRTPNHEADTGTRLNVKNKLAIFWSVQWRLSLGLGLIQALLFGGISVYGLLFNLVLVPWFSLVVIPLSFLCFLIWAGGHVFFVEFPQIFTLVDLSLVPMSMGFSMIESLPGAWISVSGQTIACLIFFMLGLLLFRVSQQRWRLVSIILCMPLLLSVLFGLLTPARSEWRLHLLDVGQGLSAVIEKSGKALIYDTGAAYGTNFSYAERVILPFLRYRGLDSVDYLVLSHSDNDHAGGAKLLVDNFPHARVITDMPEYSQLDCRPKSLLWQGLKLEILAPEIPEDGNNGSCVLRVSDGKHQLMLSGDIEKEGEVLLLDSQQTLLSEVLVVPHHGSRTSSTTAFINRISPQLVLFPAGFNNRYGFPKKDVVERYLSKGAQVLVTGSEGQISVLFRHDERRVSTYRGDLAPFWYNSLFRFGENNNTE